MSMSKIYADESIMWYDPSIKSAIEELDDQYPNAIPVFGGALSAAKYVHGDTFDLSKFCNLLANAIDNATFFGWHESSTEVARRFCHLCYIDPSLVEAYLGIEF